MTRIKTHNTIPIAIALTMLLSTSAFAAGMDYDPSKFGDAIVEVQILSGNRWTTTALATSTKPNWRVLPAHVVADRETIQFRIKSTVTGRVCPVSDIIAHPDFNPHNLDNDIAVIYVDDDYCGTPYPGWPRFVNPHLVDPIDPDEIPEALEVYGLFQSYPGGPVNLAQYTAPGISKPECASRLSAIAGAQITDRQACYFPGGGLRGGGPVVTIQNGEYRLIGVSSYEISGPAASYYPGVFTDLRNEPIWNWMDATVGGLD